MSDDTWMDAAYYRSKADDARRADDSLRAENERLREALDMCRCIIKYHVKNAGVCCTLGEKVFSALDAHEAAVAALASKDRP